MKKRISVVFEAEVPTKEGGKIRGFLPPLFYFNIRASSFARSVRLL